VPDRSSQPDHHPATGVDVWISPSRAVGDADNLPEEYALLNLSFFLADAGGSTFTDRFIHQPSTPIASTDGDCIGCQKVTLPSEIGALVRKDIYVVANFDHTDKLAAIATVADLEALTTPKLLVNNNLTIERGLPMYGMLTNVDLTEGSLPVRVMLQRTCAKIRVTLTFTDPADIGSNNRIELHDVAPYTYFVPGTGFSLSPEELINYSQVTLKQTTAQTFEGVMYLYESTTLPYLKLYTIVNGIEKIYTAKDHFPLPVRNRLYDIDIEILKRIDN
jgi:hypothetical protein